jgi:hypothetical protein
MKNFICSLMAAVLVSGCATSTYEKENDARLKLTRQMSPKWLKSHIVAGKTTQPEVHKFFGEPLLRNLSTGSSEDTNSVPLEMWTYQGGWDKKIEQPVKFIVFSFTNDIVSAYTVSQNRY